MVESTEEVAAEAVRFSKHLTPFLEELRNAGYGIGVEEYIRVQQLLLGLEPSVWKDWPALGRFIGPVVCASLEQQCDFHERFEQSAASTRGS